MKTDEARQLEFEKKTVGELERIRDESLESGRKERRTAEELSKRQDDARAAQTRILELKRQGRDHDLEMGRIAMERMQAEQKAREEAKKARDDKRQQLLAELAQAESRARRRRRCID